MENLRSDGNAVEVVLTAAVDKGELVTNAHTAAGFFGIAMEDGEIGDTIAIETSMREFELEIPSGVAAAKGAVLYADATTGAITATATNNKPVLKVTVAKDANNIIWAKLAPQV